MILDNTYILEVLDGKPTILNTELINGELCSLIVRILGGENNTYGIKLNLINMSDIVLFDEPKIIGNLYVLLGNDRYNVNKRNYELPTKWVLNDNLQITLQNVKNIKVEIKLRVKQ